MPVPLAPWLYGLNGFEGLFVPSLPLQFPDHLVHEVAVAHQVEAGMLVVQEFVGARG